jgi:hypothetical protein
VPTAVPPDGEVLVVLPLLAELAPGAVAAEPEPMDDDPLALGEDELPDISLELLDAPEAPVELLPMLELEPELMPVDEPDLPLSIEPQAESAKAHAKGIVHLIIRFS